MRTYLESGLSRLLGPRMLTAILLALNAPYTALTSCFVSAITPFNHGKYLLLFQDIYAYLNHSNQFRTSHLAFDKNLSLAQS